MYTFVVNFIAVVALGTGTEMGGGEGRKVYDTNLLMIGKYL